MKQMNAILGRHIQPPSTPELTDYITQTCVYLIFQFLKQCVPIGNLDLPSCL